MHRRSRGPCTFQPRPPRIVLTLCELSAARLVEQGVTEVSRGIDKLLWIVEAHVRKDTARRLLNRRPLKTPIPRRARQLQPLPSVNVANAAESARRLPTGPLLRDCLRRRARRRRVATRLDHLPGMCPRGRRPANRPAALSRGHPAGAKLRIRLFASPFDSSFQFSIWSSVGSRGCACTRTQNWHASD